MKVKIIAKTGKGEDSNEKEVKKTFKEVLLIASKMGGRIIDGKGYADGTMLLLEK